MQALSLGLRAPYRLKRWVTLLAQASLRLDFTRGAPLDSRVTFTRASGGTSFRPVGYGPDVKPTVGVWTPENGASITTLSPVALTLNASTGSAYAQSFVGLPVGKLCEITFVVSGMTAGYFSVNIGYASSRENVTANGTYTVRHLAAGNTALYVFAASATTATITITSVREVILDRPGDPIQLFTAPANVPRFDYAPVTRQCNGLLIEEQRTNLVPNSSLLAPSGGWALGPSLIQTGTSTIFGVPAYSFRSNANSNSYLAIFANLAAGTYTLSHLCSSGVFSSWSLGAGNSMGINATLISGGGVSSALPATITQIAADVYLWRQTFTSSGAGGITYHCGPVDLPAGAEFTVAAPQLELGSFPTSYIPTNGAAATRAAEYASINTLTPWHSAVSGTWFAEFRGGRESTQGGYGRVLSANNGDAVLGRELGAGVGTWDGTTAIQSFGADPATAWAKAAVAFNATQRDLAHNGTVRSGAHNGVFLGPTSIAIGGQNLSAQRSLNGHIRRIAYWPRRLSTLDLQGLTR